MGRLSRRFILILIIGSLIWGGLATEGVNAAAKLSVKIVSMTSPVAPGTDATVEAQTAPNAACTIAVEYASGASQASGLEQKTADGKGAVSWTWRVGPNTTPGKYPVTVSCSMGGKQASAKKSIDVKK